MWCVAELDEEYIRRMEDILAVYEKPLREREAVVCVDEKPVVLHQEVRSPQAMRPGRVARRDGEYQRGGTANVFCGVQPKAGQYFPKVTAHRSSPEFADYLLDIAVRYPKADTIHLVLDDLSSHTRQGSGGTLWREGRRPGCGIGLPCTTPRSTAAGSTRPRSRSVCFRGNAWVGAGSQSGLLCGDKPRHGVVV